MCNCMITLVIKRIVFLTIGFTQKPAAEPFCIGLTTIADTACSSGWTCMSDFFKYFHVRSLITYYVQTYDLSCCSSGFLSYIGNGRKIFLIFYVYLLIHCGTHSLHVSLHLSLWFRQVPSLFLSSLISGLHFEDFCSSITYNSSHHKKGQSRLLFRSQKNSGSFPRSFGIVYL